MTNLIKMAGIEFSATVLILRLVDIFSELNDKISRFDYKLRLF